MPSLICPPRWRASSNSPSSDGTGRRLMAELGRPDSSRAALTRSKVFALAVTTWAKSPLWCLMFLLLTLSPRLAKGRMGLLRRGVKSANVVKEK